MVDLLGCGEELHPWLCRSSCHTVLLPDLLKLGVGRVVPLGPPQSGRFCWFGLVWCVIEAADDRGLQNDNESHSCSSAGGSAHASRHPAGAPPTICARHATARTSRAAGVSCPELLVRKSALGGLGGADRGGVLG